MNYYITHISNELGNFSQTINWCRDNIEWENPFRWNRDVYTNSNSNSNLMWECNYYFNDKSDAMWFWMVW